MGSVICTPSKAGFFGASADRQRPLTMVAMAAGIQFATVGIRKSARPHLGLARQAGIGLGARMSELQDDPPPAS